MAEIWVANEIIIWIMVAFKTGIAMEVKMLEYLIIFLLIVIAMILFNISHFCRGIKRDLFEIKTGKKWDYEDDTD